MHIRSLALAGALCLLASSGASEEPATDLRPDMHALLESLQELLPLVSDEAALRDPQTRSRLEEALRNLMMRTGALDAHASDLDAGSRYTGRALAMDARRAVHHLDAGDPSAAAFTVRQLTHHCAACHTRLQDQQPRAAAIELAQSDEVAKLAPVTRARVLMATRRFDEALEVLEAELTSDSPEPLELVGPLIDYVVVCVRVRNDPLRAAKTLERFAQRDDLWLQLARDADVWARTLRKLAAREPGPDPIAWARQLIDEGRARIAFPSDRRALIEYVFASRALHEYVAEESGSPNEMARAYYLLGLVESRIGRSFWSSEAAYFLESAIRAAPGSEAARDAYAVLEEETLAGFSGSAGLRLPGDVSAHLEGLRELMDSTGGESTHPR